MNDRNGNELSIGDVVRIKKESNDLWTVDGFKGMYVVIQRNKRKLNKYPMNLIKVNKDGT